MEASVGDVYRWEFSWNETLRGTIFLTAKGRAVTVRALRVSLLEKISYIDGNIGLADSADTVIARG